MIFNVAQLIAEASTKWTLERGDLLLTGTPAVNFNFMYFIKVFYLFYFRALVL